MIIECVNCGKKFDVNSDLIPSEGRTIQCGSCNHIWFFKKKDPLPLNISKSEPVEKNTVSDISDGYSDKDIRKNQSTKTVIQNNLINTKTKKSEIVKYKSKSNFTFNNFLSYIIVLIISFVGLILIIDTFKFQIYNFYPDLEILMYSFYETLKDIQSFIIDLT
tara:strand:+ start:34 stop:522 length:489 start_codon:yes stop_codon:yes gene_type:complete